MEVVNIEAAKREAKLKDYLFWFRTPQTGTLKTLFDAIKEILPDGHLIITEEGIRLEGSDSSHVIIVNMFLEADKIKETGEFFCAEPLRVGIDMKNFNIFLKNAEPRDIITLCVERNTPSNSKKEDFLCIRFENQETHSVENHRLSTLTLQNDSVRIPPHKYTCVRPISSAALQRYIKTMKSIGETCKITNVNDNELRLSVDGLIGKFDVQLVSRDDSDDEDDESSDDDATKQSAGKEPESETPNNQLIVGEFKIKYLEYLIKPSNLCSKILLGIDHEVPIIVQFKIASLGKLQYIIAQHLDDAD